VDWLSGVAVPDDARLPLVRDADRRYIGRGGAYLLHGFEGYGNLRRNNLLRIVLDPSGLREYLIELSLRDRTNCSALIE
jgi:hypothetical protein